MSTDTAFTIRLATPADDQARGHLLAAIYHEDGDKLAAELTEVRAKYSDGGVLTPLLIAWVAVNDAGDIIAVLEAGMRLSANGCETLNLLFIEGVAVAPAFRGAGVGAALMATATQWARDRGIRELASDVEIDNAGSQRWHKMMGFTETERVICYRKQLD